METGATTGPEGSLVVLCVLPWLVAHAASVRQPPLRSAGRTQGCVRYAVGLRATPALGLPLFLLHDPGFCATALEGRQLLKNSVGASFGQDAPTSRARQEAVVTATLGRSLTVAASWHIGTD